jgi:hypothetical protein
MNLFGLFKSKQEKNVEKIKEEAFNKIFPGGDKQIDIEVDEISNLIGDKYPRAQLAKAYIRVAYSFFLSQDKREETVVQSVRDMMNGKNAKEDFLKIYNYTKIKFLKQQFGTEDPSELEEFASRMFGGNVGCDSDEIPGGFGEFGYSVNNPIPTNGIMGSNTYLSRLKLISGNIESEWGRTGPRVAENIENVIDEYQLSSPSGERIAVIYISPYHRRNSEKAPNGFKLA